MSVLSTLAAKAMEEKSNLQLNDRPLSSSDLDLELPVEPGFKSMPPKLSVAEHARFCDEMVAFNYRLRGRDVRPVPTSVEFIL